VVIVIIGPIASGKSTVANELARELRRDDVRVEVIDLDLVHDRLDADGSVSDDGTWTLARRGTASMANSLLERGAAVVVADGSFNFPGDRAAFVEQLRPGSGVLFVTLQVSFEEALRRAEGDPGRGMSRDPGFLGSHFAEREHLLAAVPATDMVIDTERTTPHDAARRITRRVRADLDRKVEGRPAADR